MAIETTPGDRLVHASPPAGAVAAPAVGCGPRASLPALSAVIAAADFNTPRRVELTVLLIFADLLPNE
jgi:hypothetical protein